MSRPASLSTEKVGVTNEYRCSRDREEICSAIELDKNAAKLCKLNGCAPRYPLAVVVSRGAILETATVGACIACGVSEYVPLRKRSGLKLVAAQERVLKFSVGIDQLTKATMSASGCRNSTRTRR